MVKSLNENAPLLPSYSKGENAYQGFGCTVNKVTYSLLIGINLVVI